MAKRRTKSPLCARPGCSQQRLPNSKYCVFCHEVVGYNRRAARARNRRDPVAIVGNTLAAMAMNWLGQKANTGELPVINPFQQRPRPQGQPPPPRRDPFEVLGLDPMTATEEQIRRVQRGCAEMWHSDKGGGTAAQSRLGEINAAAEEALRILRQRANTG